MTALVACGDELNTLESIQKEREMNLQSYIDFCKKEVSQHTGSIQSVLLAENMMFEFKRDQQIDKELKIQYQEKIVANLKKLYEVKSELNGGGYETVSEKVLAKENWLKEKQNLIEMRK